MPTRSACLILVLAASSPLAAARKVAVLEPKAEAGVSAGVASLLADVMATDLSKDSQYSVLTAGDVTAMLGFDRQRSMLGCDDNSCYAELAGAIGADEIAALSVGAVGSMRVVTLRRIDLKAGRAVRRESQTVNDEDSLVGAVRQMTAKVFDLTAPISSSSKANPGWFVVGGAGAVALAGLGVGLAANADYQSFKATPFDDPLGDRASLRAHVADGLYATAIVAAVVGVVVLIVNRNPAAGAAGGVP